MSEASLTTEKYNGATTTTTTTHQGGADTDTKIGPSKNNTDTRISLQNLIGNRSEDAKDRNTIHLEIIINE